jgi:hypothetical protein
VSAASQRRIWKRRNPRVGGSPHPGSYAISEGEIKALGYRSMGRKAFLEALAVFEFNGRPAFTLPGDDRRAVGLKRAA